MPDIFAELSADWHRAADGMRHLMRHGTPQPAALAPAAPVPHNGTQEVTPMSFVDSLKADAQNFLAKLETVDHTALDALERIQACPDTAEAFALLDAVTKLPIGPGVLTTAIDVLKLTLGQAAAAVPQPVQPAAEFAQPQVAGPVVGGQA